ncbi:hypothetical protein PFISCL1PPCAC_21026, partial [Pristionchus fissidentatus]
QREKAGDGRAGGERIHAASALRRRSWTTDYALHWLCQRPRCRPRLCFSCDGRGRRGGGGGKSPTTNSCLPKERDTANGRFFVHPAAARCRHERGDDGSG